MKSNWQIKKLGDLCEIVTDKPDKFIGTKKYYATGGINNRGNYTYELVDYETRPGRADLMPEVGDVGFAKMKNTNKVFRIDENLKGSIFSTGFSFLRAKVGILSEYLFIFVASDEFQKIKDNLAGDGIMGGIKKSDISNIELYLPPIEMQKIIIKIINKVFEKTTKAKENAERNLQNARELFESYLQNVFTNPGDGWEKKSLKALGNITSSKRIFKREYVKEGIPFYRTKEIKELSHGKNISLELFISRERYNEIKTNFGIPKEGDILLSAVGTIGEIYVVQKNDEFYFKDGNIVWLKDFNSVDTYYLKYALESFVEQIKTLSRGSAYNALTIEKLNKYKVPITSIKEQRIIISKLDALSAETKKLEVIYQQKLNDLEELKKSILKKAFKGELKGCNYE